jgi:hypothetical protein
MFFKALCVLALILGRHADIVAAGATQFQQWFPQYGGVVQTSLDANCSGQYRDYLSHNVTSCPVDTRACLASSVVICILTSLDEGMKANFASAAVLLGIMPSTLGLGGSNTIETALLAQRRPIFALLLAGGSPAVSLFKAFEDVKLHRYFSIKPINSASPTLPRPAAVALVLLEYVFAILAVTNVVHVCWELSNMAVCSFTPETAYMPLLWACLALCVHLSGAETNRLRITLLGKRPTAIEFFKREFQLNARLPSKIVRLKKSKSKRFLLCSWITSIGSALHIMFGTLVFSSILFIGTKDAAFVVLRFLASATTCRAILVFELSGMKKVVFIDLEDEPAARDDRLPLLNLATVTNT